MGIDEYSILKKKPKKNAFAATALLISIAIALLVMVGAVLVLSKVNDKDRITPASDNGSEKEDSKSDDSTTCEGLVKEIVFNDNLTNIKEAAINYFTNERLPQEVGETEKITLKEMTDKKLVRTVRDASAKTCDVNKSYVEVTKDEDEYVMKVFLSCSDLEDYIIVHLGCYDYCDKDVCEKKEKVYEYEYKKTTACTMSPWSDWGNWKTTREKTSNLKKEDIKVEKSTTERTVTRDANSNVTYSCDKYGDDYDLVGTNCVRATTITKKEKADPNPTTYNCNKYSKEYKLVGNECIRNYTETDIQKADPNPTTYNCNKYSKEYKLVGNECVRNYTEKVTVKADLVSYTCTHYGSDYKVSGSNCVKTVDAEAVYDKKTVTEYYTCYKEECTTKTIFSCPTTNSCGDYPVTSCESVKKTCSRKVQKDYIKEYKCPDDSYVMSQDKDGKNICTSTKTAKPVYNCKSHPGYDLVGTACVKQEPKTDKQKADPNPTTYNCNKWTGYDKVGSTCVKDLPKTDKQKADPNPTTYNCNKWTGYDLSGAYCVKVEPSKDTKEAKKIVNYTCPTGYDYNDKTKTCSTKKTDEVKVTYYRYATRTCNGGSSSIEWSTSKNDTILKSEGYKLTGNKRVVKEEIVK